jgi:hypothetical protein
MATLTSAAVATGDNVRAVDHNSLVVDVGAINQELQSVLVLALVLGD